MRNRLLLFSGNSNPVLARDVCSCLGIEPSSALVGSFSDGEVRVEILDNARGKDVYVVQSVCPPVNQNLIEVLVLIDALRRASVRRVNTVIPYYGYGRQDQKEKPRVPLAARVVADLLTTAGSGRVITMDLHAAQIEGFFTIPVEHISGTGALLEDLKKSLRGDEIIVAPDAGGVQRARDFASRLNVDLAILDRRSEDGGPGTRIVGSVEGRRVVILDDMVNTGRTLVRTAENAVVAGAAFVDAYCVHAVLSGSAVDRIEASPLRSLIVTDTVPLSQRAASCGKIRTVSIAPELAEAIRRVHAEESVDALMELP